MSHGSVIPHWLGVTLAVSLFVIGIALLFLAEWRR